MSKKVRRPFHETIVDAISRASVDQLYGLMTLIQATKIPDNHNEIMQALETRADEIGLNPLYKIDVLANLLEQKEEVERERLRKENLKADKEFEEVHKFIS